MDIQHLMKFLTKMKMMNKFILVIFLCLIVSTTGFSSSDTASKAGFDFYSSYLSSTLYPKVRSYLKPNKRVLSKEDAINLTNEVAILVLDDLKENKIVLVSSPKIKIYKAENYNNVAFILQIELNILDKEESLKDLYLDLKISKTFLIFFASKKEGVKV